MRAKQRQCWIDLAIQHIGSVDKVFELAVANGISITEDPDAAIEYAVPVKALPVAATYAAQHYVPATSADIDAAAIQGGIDFMRIEYDFIIS